jgi:plastocyanin
MLQSRWMAIAGITLVAACSGNSTGYGGNPPPPPPPSPPPGGHSTTITVANNSFSPTPDTVPAGTVTFHWAANAITHNVTWLTGPGTLPTGSGDRAGGAADYLPTVQGGTYTYHCTHHGGMDGTLVVTP